jgi:lysophospholipase L1-like esterase
MVSHSRTRRFAASAAAATMAVGAMTAVLPASPAVAATKAEKRQWAKTRVYVQGDSLTVGSASPLRSQLSGKVRRTTVDAAIGRHTATGMSRLANDPRARRSQVWVVALGTNDAPDPGAIRNHVRRSLRLAGPQRDVIWLTLRRPGGYDRVNTMLRSLDRKRERLHVVDWARKTHSSGWLLRSDGVHATHDGYRTRAHMITRTTLAVAGDPR